jgi:hypothetical protein
MQRWSASSPDNLLNIGHALALQPSAEFPELP